MSREEGKTEGKRKEDMGRRGEEEVGRRRKEEEEK